MSLRSFLYKTASFLGDLEAIKKGKFGERLVRKAAYRTGGGLVNKVLNSIFKKF